MCLCLCRCFVKLQCVELSSHHRSGPDLCPGSTTPHINPLQPELTDTKKPQAALNHDVGTGLRSPYIPLPLVHSFHPPALSYQVGYLAHFLSQVSCIHSSRGTLGSSSSTCLVNLDIRTMSGLSVVVSVMPAASRGQSGATGPSWPFLALQLSLMAPQLLAQRRHSLYCVSSAFYKYALFSPAKWSCCFATSVAGAFCSSESFPGFSMHFDSKLCQIPILCRFITFSWLRNYSM